MDNQQNYKIPPRFECEGSISYDAWKKKVKAWKYVTDLHKSKQALALALSQEGLTREIAFEVDIDAMNTDQGMRILLEHMDKNIQRIEKESAFQAYQKFESLERNKGVKIGDYLMEFEKRYNQMKKYKMELPNGVLACKLLNSANISQEFKIMFLASTPGPGLEYEQVKHALKRTHEHLFHSPLDAEKHEVYRSTPKNRPVKFMNKGNKLDPIGLDRKRSRCRKCESILHWLRDCPHCFRQAGGKDQLLVSQGHDEQSGYDVDTTTEISQEVCDELAYKKNPSSRDLAAVLSQPFMMSLMRAHDDVAKDTEMSVASSNNEDANIVQRASMYNVRKPIRIVRINKHNDPLGATVRIDENDGRVIISRIVTGGAADKSRLLRENDEIVEVNGEPMKGKDVNTVGDMIAGMNGLLTFVIVPADDKDIPNGHVNNGYDDNREPVMHVRALFDYDAYDDPYLPCRELGLSFQKGDILHIMTQDDKDWWQAYREGEEDKLTLPGLIPSLNFHMQRETVRISFEKKEPEPENEKGILCGRKGRKKNKKKKKSQTPIEEDPIEVYEEMALYHQPEEKKRPIVLIGPPNVGRAELRQRLVENDKNRFNFAIPHTTRQMAPDEEEGEEYHFISMKLFEQMMADGKFIEHGSYLKNIYGTTFESVETVIKSGKICVLNMHAHSLKQIKSSTLKPYIIFIAPPPLERLRQNMAKEGKQIKEDELRSIIENAREIEHTYAHYFDETIRNIDLSRSYAELLRLINKLDTEPQWVPATWID